MSGPCFVVSQVFEKLLAFSAPADLDGAASSIKAAQGHLADIKSTAAAAADAGDAIVEKCFDAAVNRALMSPTPPRRMPVGALAALHLRTTHLYDLLVHRSSSQLEMFDIICNKGNLSIDIASINCFVHIFQCV